MREPLTNMGFYILSTYMPTVQNMAAKFGCCLVSKHREMFDAFQVKLAEILKKEVTDPALKQEAVDLWRVRLSVAPLEIRQQFDLPELDTGFRLILYTDAKYKRTYGVCATHHMDWYYKWLQEDLVAGYCFEDTDQCKEYLGADEFDRRKADWERVIPFPEQPRLFAFEINLVRLDSPLTTQDLLGGDHERKASC